MTETPPAPDADSPGPPPGTPFELEPHDDGGATGDRETAPCPRCGAELPDGASSRCLRCSAPAPGEPRDDELLPGEDDSAAAGGLDAAGRAALDADDGDLVLTRPDRGGPWAPAVTGGIALIVVLGGCLAGASGLFPRRAADAAEAISFAARLDACGRVLILAAVWIGSAIAALHVIAWLADVRIGDRRVAALRVAGSILVAFLVAFVDLPWLVVERGVELVVQIVVFGALSVVLFRLTPRQAAVLVGLTIALRFGALLAAWLVVQTGW